MIPSVTRVFSRSRDRYVYLQAYEQTARSIEPLVAFVSFYRGQTKAFETQPKVRDGLHNRLKTMPASFSIARNELSAGRVPGDGARPNRTEGSILAGFPLSSCRNLDPGFNRFAVRETTKRRCWQKRQPLFSGRRGPLVVTKKN